jgi:hypothetical protein
MSFNLWFKPFCLWACFFTSSGLATQFVPLSIEELADKADIVVQGTVQSKTCARDDKGRIFTRVELAVSETWKGPLSTNLSIFQSGGILGEDGAMIPGQAAYEIGEEVVAFLVRNSRGEAVTLGLAHGKFHIGKDLKSGEKFAGNIFHAGNARRMSNGANPSPPLKLADLKRRALQRTP